MKWVYNYIENSLKRIRLSSANILLLISRQSKRLKDQHSLQNKGESKYIKQKHGYTGAEYLIFINNFQRIIDVFKNSLLI